MNESRILKVRQELYARDLDAIFLSNMTNIRYISGFDGSYGYILVTGNEAFLLTDSRYTLQAKEQAKHFKVMEVGSDFFEKLNELAKESRIKSLGFEEHTITYSKYEELRRKLQVEKLLPAQQILTDLRKTKDETEIEKIKRAAGITDHSFSYIIDWIKPGMTELEVALELEYFMRKSGAEEVSFDIIVASGFRSALPHGRPSNKKIETGELVVLDFGCIYEGYCSDMTRTIGVGHLDDQKKKIYNIVLEAQLRALEFIRSGKTGIEVDAVARKIITDSGHGDFFGHGLGHGVGCEIHEAPTLSPRGKENLQQNMVVTIEPGIYIEGVGGVRIEDLVSITDGAICNFTSSSKELIII